MTVVIAHDDVRSWRALEAPIPTIAVGVVLRKPVLELLLGSTGRLVVVDAPAGYGKTTHVNAWSQRDGRPVVRIGLDRSCNDLDTFVSTVIGELSLVVDFSLGPLLRPSAATHEHATLVVPAIAKRLRLCATAFILVLDDVHVIDRPEVTELIRAIAANVPSGSTVVLVGRAVDHLQLARIREFSRAAVVGPQDLALGADDACELFDQLEVAADDEQLAALVQHADGWPLGIRLAALAERLTGVRDSGLRSTSSNDRSDDLSRASEFQAPSRTGDMGSDRRCLRLANDPAPAFVNRRRDRGVALANGVSLTTAELRVLPYLPTNLTFERVAERLFVSRNTVKSHVAALYRKLGVTCRHDAVERARILGLLVDDGYQTGQ
jgi:ATP/maltotriose-dependent transcriptional regulator MalT